MEKTLGEKIEKKKPRFLQRFIFWFLIPLLFILLLGLLIASILGVNVFEKAKGIAEKLPVVTQVVGEKEKIDIAEYEEKLISLDAEIQEKNAQIDQLETVIENKEAEAEELLLEQKRLEQTIEELKQIQNENKRGFKEIVSTYEAMSPKKAAPIILEMKEDEAVKILSNINTKVLAKVMEKMPPDQAAYYSELLAAKAE